MGSPNTSFQVSCFSDSNRVMEEYVLFVVPDREADLMLVSRIHPGLIELCP